MLLYRVKRYLMLSLELLVVETKNFAKVVVKGYCIYMAFFLGQLHSCNQNKLTLFYVSLRSLLHRS